jgi:hypothetical protein
LKRWHLRPIKDLELADRDLDVTGRNSRVLRARRTPAHRATNAQHVFVAQMLGLRETLVLRIEDDLAYSFVIAKIDEYQAAVIAAPIHPSV